MRTWRKHATSLGFLLTAAVSFAQDTLSLSEAVSLALANEHGIRIAKNEAAIADAQATAGNAGLLPRVDASGRGNYSNQDTKLDFTEGIPDVERNAVVNTALGGQVGLTYTLFNGMGNFATLERAQLNAQLADLRTRAQVEGTLTQVIALYYAIAALDEDCPSRSVSWRSAPTGSNGRKARRPLAARAAWMCSTRKWICSRIAQRTSWPCSDASAVRVS